MRLIDADELKVEEMRVSSVMLDGDEKKRITFDLLTYTPKEVQRLIDNAPTIDIAEVCGECKPYEPCIYCKHEFENRFETCGAKMDGGGDSE